MPRKPIIRSSDHFYHVTGRSNNREDFFLPVNLVWELMTKRLGELQKKFGIEIGAFVLMDNHFHLLVLTPNEDIDRIMYFFMKDVTKDLQKKSSRINRIFGGRYKGSLIESKNYLLNVVKYIYRNPVEAGLSAGAEDYPYSSLFYDNQSSKLSFRVEKISPSISKYDHSEILKWINSKFGNDESQSIKRGLQKTIFSYLRDRATGKLIIPSYHFK